MGGTLARMGELRNAYKILVTKPERRDLCIDAWILIRLILNK
jgi:hypothetical protein